MGNDGTGKTTFQKEIIQYLCGLEEIQRLHVNKVFPITHPDAPEDFKSLFAMNRSFQEKKDTYGSLEIFFTDHFKDADICFLSSHLVTADIQGMIDALHFRMYNVGAIFLGNVPEEENGPRSMLNWDERFWLDNPITEAWQVQIRRLAIKFGDMVLHRAEFQ